MPNRPEYYLKSIELMIEDQKMLLAVSAVPLITIIAKIDVIAKERDAIIASDWSVNCITSLAIICFLISGALSAIAISYGRNCLASMAYRESGKPLGLSEYHRFRKWAWVFIGREFAEADLIRMYKFVWFPIVLALLFGWSSVFILIRGFLFEVNIS